MHSLTVDELLALTGDADDVLRRLRDTRLTYGHIIGSPRAPRRDRRPCTASASAPTTCSSTNGAIGANFLALFALTEPGAGVVCVKPTYQQLYSVPQALGADLRLLPLREKNGYLPDVDELRSLVDDATRLIVVNNPNNPTGALMDEALLREIVAVARERDAWLLCDEVYRMLEHDPGTRPPSVVDLYEKGVSTGSMSKSYSLAGLRTGWVAGPPEALARCLEVRDYTTITCGVLDDILATVTLEHRDAVLERNLEIVRGNLAIVDEWVEREERLRYVRPRAGTTALIRYDYRGALAGVLPGDVRPQRRLRRARRRLRRGVRLPPRLRVRPRRPRGRARRRVGLPAHARGLSPARRGRAAVRRPGPCRPAIGTAAPATPRLRRRSLPAA